MLSHKNAIDFLSHLSLLLDRDTRCIPLCLFYFPRGLPVDFTDGCTRTTEVLEVSIANHSLIHLLRGAAVTGSQQHPTAKVLRH